MTRFGSATWKFSQETLTEHTVFGRMGQFFCLRQVVRMADVLIRWRRLFSLQFIAIAFLLVGAGAVMAQENPFSVPSDLTSAVDFWKQIFTQISSKEVVFFDPKDLGKIYSVLRVPENDEGRILMDRERARIIADYELNEEDGRVRSQRGAKELFLSGLKTSGRYVTQMRTIFRSEGLPQDLAYLPLVESSFNVRARSSVGAAGMWQFMLNTGKKFLRIDDAVDERLDPMASTRAAARLLKENYKLFGNWPLAVTAYNHGTEGIFQGINTVGSQNLTDLIRSYQSPTFGFASKNFYAEFLAAAEIGRNGESYFPFIRALPPVTFHELPINRPFPIHSFLKPAAINSKDFFEWNPALNPTIKSVPAGYRVKLPPEKLNLFLAAQRKLQSEPTIKKVATTTKRRDGGVSSAQSGSSKKQLVKRRVPNRASVTSLPNSIRSSERQAKLG